jgi:hypothetical protein
MIFRFVSFYVYTHVMNFPFAIGMIELIIMAIRNVIFL